MNAIPKEAILGSIAEHPSVKALLKSGGILMVCFPVFLLLFILGLIAAKKLFHKS
jgi:hypothetical protein